MVDAAPGYQGSERSHGELVIYPQSGDPIIISGMGKVEFTGKKITDEVGSLVSLGTSKTLESASGTWNAMIKPSAKGAELLDQLTDDDWVDVIFYRHGKRWHVMRGLLDNIQLSERVGSKGATVRSYGLSGRDFGVIFERTPVWFSPYTDEKITGGVSLQVFGGALNIMGDPSNAVLGFLSGFLDALGSTGRAVWKIPNDVPGLGGQDFGAMIRIMFDKEGFTNDPARIAINPNYLNPVGNLWSLAKEWSDPVFCELFCDTLMPESSAPVYAVEDISEAPPEKTVLQVIFRDRTFPTQAKGKDSAYYSLLTHVIPRQLITGMTLARGGAERFNAFFVAPQVSQELTGAGAIDLLAPLWSPDDIRRHGLRRFDIQTKYVSTKAELLIMSKAQREIVRDWYCMNPYLLHGSVALGRGFPQIHVGQRLIVPSGDPKKPEKDRSFYIEGVSHNWTFGSSTKTNLDVTRGWVGTDDQYINALGALASPSNYVVGNKSEPGDGLKSGL
jgi:hypothetical protein